METSTIANEPVLQSEGASNNDSKTQRRLAATLPAQANRSRSYSASIGFAVIALLIGMLLGALIMRQRYHAKQIVAAVNGELITQDDLYGQLERMAGKSALQSVVEERLVLQFAKRQGINPSDSEVSARYLEVSKEPGFTEALAKSGRTPEDIRWSLRVQLAKAKMFEKDVQVTQEEILKFYQQNISRTDTNARYYTPETVQIAVITTKSQTKALQALTDLRHGVPFSTVAKMYSEDESKDNGGIVNKIVRGRSQAAKVKPFENLIFNLHIGERTGPVRAVGLWWIIQCLDKQSEQTVPFERVQKECRTGAALTKGVELNRSKFEASYQQFRRSATVQAFWPQYKDALQIK